MTVRLGMRSVAPSASIVTPRASIAVARTPSRTVTPSRPARLAALAESDSPKAGEHALAGVEQDHSRVARDDPRECPSLRVLGDDREQRRRPPRRSVRRRRREGQPLRPGGRVVRPLGLLEGAVDAVAQVDGVGQGLEPARDVRPLVVAEVGRLRAAGDDQAVVVEALAAVEDDLPPLDVDVRRPRPSARPCCALRRSDGRIVAAHSPSATAPAATW